MNRAYRLTPVSQYDIPGLESWLEDMSRLGLFLKKFRPLFCTFIKGEPKPTRYRLETCKRGANEDPPQSMVELYQDFGWTLAGELDHSMLVFSTQDMEAEELHTDPAIQGELWKKLFRQVRRSFWGSLLSTALILSFSIFFLLYRGTPVLDLLTSPTLSLLLFSIYKLALLPAAAADLRRLSKAARQLKEGVPLDHRSAYPRRRYAAALSLLGAVVLLTLMVVGQFILPLTGSGLLPLERMEDFVPLSLETLEGEGFMDLHPVAGNGVDYANFCERERYLLCQQKWRVVQTGDGNAFGPLVRMEIQWYDLPVRLLSRPLARELLDKAVTGQSAGDYIWWTPGQDLPWTTEEFPSQNADFLAVAQTADGRHQAAVVSLGDKTALVRYTGNGSLADHLEELTAMVAP